ncbi:MAG: hypothetical protein WBQ27_14645, partial [Thermoanaerobaculia bacterium]
LLYNVGCVYSLAGELDRALECIEKSVSSGLAYIEWLRQDSNLDPLRDHPRFQALLTGYGQEEGEAVVRQNPIRPRKSLTPRIARRQTELIPEIFFALERTLRSALKVRRDLVLENLAPRHQLAVLTRPGNRPRLRPAERFLWTSPRCLWDRWRQSLVLMRHGASSGKPPVSR